MTYQMLVVPADPAQPITTVDAEESDLGKLVFGEQHPERNELSLSPFRAWGTQCAYDDLGLYRVDGRVNERAMKLWAKLTNVGTPSWTSPLIGTFVFLGYNPNDGETADVPADVVELAKELA